MKKSNYKYQVGEIVNGTLKIVSQTKKGKRNFKSYEVQSLIYPDAPNYTVFESSLLNGSGCAYKSSQRIYEGNSLYSIESLRPYIVDVEEAKTISKGGNKYKIKVKCIECQKEKLMTPYKLSTRGFFCELCDKGASYPENFFKSYLKVKGIKYEYQKVFKDLPDRRFDFYLPESNTVIETHGIQHYKESGNWDFKETQNSDQIKKEYCQKHNINLVVIDSSKSNFQFMKNTINKTEELEPIQDNEVNLILQNIEEIRNYPVKKIIDMNKKGKNTKEIENELDVPQATVLNILNRHNLSAKRKKAVRCRTTGEEFESIVEAQKKYHAPNIGKACKSKSIRAFSGRHPETNMKLKWEYIED
ncbi:hypothetical protein PALS1_031 [Staphylococcus phage PALS_1]|nr:hypothetical protein PALS1_031 [Staphylococcus phage PALS_1]